VAATVSAPPPHLTAADNLLDLSGGTSLIIDENPLANSKLPSRRLTLQILRTVSGGIRRCLSRSPSRNPKSNSCAYKCLVSIHLSDLPEKK
jgi:hypothetical protein